MLVGTRDRDKHDVFLKGLKEEWAILWKERFDDKVRAEGISVRDHPLLFVDRGFVIFASRNAMALSFSEIVDFWASQGFVYAPDPSVGGWGKFIRTELSNLIHSRARLVDDSRHKHKDEKQQLKKGGRGWLHIQ